MEKIKVHIVSHTHWDREWYLPFEEMRIKLVDLIDTLIDILENDEKYYSFLMDGQTIILEDYLDVKPQNKERLKKLISSGKMQIGPWYVLPDELLISGESHIRNFIEGRRVSEQFGGEMNIGYLPDSFGHPAQMPQILKGLGMDTIIFWRGASHDIDKTEFNWCAVDGTYVLGLHMPLGYGNSARLSNDISNTLPRVENLLETLSFASTTGVILLMNGSDHIFPQPDLYEIIQRLNEKLPNVEIRHSTLSEYVDEIKSGIETSRVKLKNIFGELRYTHRSLLLGGTISTRMYLKQMNHMVEKGMERYVEPFCCLDALKGGRYPKELIIHGWRSILQNHPHDSICGCSIDSVHREMTTRYEKIEQLENDLLIRAMKSIAGRIKPEHEFDACVTLFNPTQETRTEYIEIEADLDRMIVMEVNFDKSCLDNYEDSMDHPQFPEGVEVFDSMGRRLDAVLLSVRKDYEMIKSNDTMPEVYKVNRCKIGLYVNRLKPLGYTTLYIKKSNMKTIKPKSDICAEKIENEYYTVEVEPAGTFQVTDKSTGKVYKGCNRFVDGGDAGDEYTYSYPEKDSFYHFDESSIKVTGAIFGDFMQQIILEGILHLPISLTPDRKSRATSFVSCPVKTTVTLKKGVKILSFKTEIINSAKDHRLQVLFPSGVLSDKSYAESQFAVIPRNIEPDNTEDWKELPPTTHPQKGFVDVNDGISGAAVINCGLPEFEVKNTEGQSWIGITLLRCVGWLSRDDLLTRNGNGGWTLETPEAQCLGRHSFEYGFMPHKGTWEDGEVYKVSDNFIHPVKYIQAYEFSNSEADHMSFIKYMPDKWRISAIKIAEDGDGFIVRFFNISTKPEKGRIEFGFHIASAEKVTLDERKVSELKVNGCRIYLELSKGEIKTIRIRNRNAK